MDTWNSSEEDDDKESDVEVDTGSDDDDEMNKDIDNEVDDDFDPYIGMTVKKLFNDEQFYYGEVITDASLVWDNNQRREVKAWTVKYSDGQEEDMYKEELQKWCCSDVQFNAEEKALFESFFDEEGLKTFYSSCEGEDDSKVVQELKKECLKRGINVRRTWGKEQILQTLNSMKI